MLGVVAAMGYEIFQGRSLIVQINEAPVLIAATFLTITGRSISSLYLMVFFVVNPRLLTSGGCTLVFAVWEH